MTNEEVVSGAAADRTLATAITHHQAGRLNEAAAHYRAILTIMPGHPDASHNLGVLAMQIGQLSQALPLLRSAKETHDKNIQYRCSLIECLLRLSAVKSARFEVNELEALIGKADIVIGYLARLSEMDTEASAHAIEDVLAKANALREAGEWGKALVYVEDQLRVYPRSADLWAFAAIIYPQVKQWDGAEKAARRALSIDPENPDALRALANVFIKEQRIDEAEVCAVKSIQRKRTPLALTTLAAIRLAQQRLDEAAQFIDQALADDEIAEAYASRAILEAQRGAIQAAIGQGEKAVSIKPFLTSVWRILASLYHLSGKLGMVLRAMEKIAELEPNDADNLCNLGELYRRVDRAQDAVPILERAIYLMPGSTTAWCNYGAVLQALGRSAEAEDAYRRALAIDANFAVAHNNIGILRRAEGDWEGALTGFAEACRLKADDAALQANYAVALAKMRRFRDAEGAISLARQLDENNKTIVSAAASVAREKQCWDEAEKLLRTRIARDSSDAESWLHLGDLLFTMGSFDEAMSAVSQALKLRPSYVEANSLYGVLLCDQGRFSDARDIHVSYLKAHVAADWMNPLANSRRLRDAEIEVATNLLLSLWALGDFEHGRSVAAALQTYMQPSVNIHKNTRAYLQYLIALFDQTNAIDSAENNKDQILAFKATPLFVIGDSHSLASANLLFSCHKKKYLAKPIFLVGIKMWHVLQKNPSHRRIAMESRIQALPKGAELLITIGEIDCRPSEGIWPASKKLDKSPRRVAEDTVRGYLDWLVGTLDKVEPANVILQGIPAPGYEISDAVVGGQCEKFLNVIDHVNSLLYEGARTLGWQFLDVHSATANEVRMSNHQWHLDAFHLKPSFYADSSRWLLS